MPRQGNLFVLTPFMTRPQVQPNKFQVYITLYGWLTAVCHGCNFHRDDANCCLTSVIISRAFFLPRDQRMSQSQSGSHLRFSSFPHLADLAVVSVSFQAQVLSNFTWITKASGGGRCASGKKLGNAVEAAVDRKLTAETATDCHKMVSGSLLPHWSC